MSNRIRRVEVAIVAAAFVPLALVNGKGQSTTPLPVESVITTAFFNFHNRVELSPDGEYVAYAVRDRQPTPVAIGKRFTHTGASIDGDANHVYVTGIMSGQTTQMGGSLGSSWAPVWSPDGKQLAFYSDQSGKAQLWVWERATEKSRPVSDAIVRPFLSFEEPRWTPDGHSILCKLLPEGMTLESGSSVGSPGAISTTTPETRSVAPTIQVFRSPEEPERSSASSVAPAGTNELEADLALVDASSGKLQRLVRRVNPQWYAPSSDGKYIAFTSHKGVAPNSFRHLYDIVIYSLAEKQTRVVGTAIPQPYGVGISWSPDGKNLSYISGITYLPTDAGRSRPQCFIVPADGGPVREIAAGAFDLNDVPLARYEQPLWDDVGRYLYYRTTHSIWRVTLETGQVEELARITDRVITNIITSREGVVWQAAGGGTLIVSTFDQETERSGFSKVELATGRTKELTQAQQTHGGHPLFTMQGSQDGKQLVYLAEGAEQPANLWISSLDFLNPRRITHVNPQFDGYSLGQSRLVDWQNSRGEKLRGALLLPAGYKEGQRYPLLVWVYAGDRGSEAINQFGFRDGVFNMQMFATRGYAVLFPDAPVRRGSPARDIAEAVLPGVDRVIGVGIADPQRLGVMGQSYGGYSALALITQTQRFKAAVVSAALSDLISSYFRMDDSGKANNGYVETGQGNMRGTPWEHLDEYVENSPVFHLDKVRTPLLITNGTNDPFSIGQSEEVFVGLRRLGQEVEYVRYIGEGHVVALPGNQRDFCERRIKWFDDHLKK